MPSMISGGVERGTVDIANACVAGGFISIIASAGGSMLRQLNNKVMHYKIPLDSKNPFRMIAHIKRIEDIIKEHNVDIVHARSRAPAWSGYFASKRCKCHFITTFHGVYSFNNVLKKYYNSIMTKGVRIVVGSRFIQNHVIDHYNVDEKKISFIPRGIDTHLFNCDNVSEDKINKIKKHLNIQHKWPIILLPGRLTEWKGHMFLVKALARLSSFHYTPSQSFSRFLGQRFDSETTLEKPRISRAFSRVVSESKIKPKSLENDLEWVYTCLFVGDDKGHYHYVKRLKRQINQMKLDKKVFIVTHVEDMAPLYKLADIVVSASIRPESFGRVAAEAQSMERLIIATNHGGSRDTVLPGKTGWLVDKSNIASLTEALKEALSLKKEQRDKIGKKGRKNIINNFSNKQMFDKTLSLYKDLCKSSAPHL